MIPTFIVEEHHEAFFVWTYAVANGIISGRRNTLLHVDEHADLSSPRLATSLKELGQSLPAVFTFTKNELGIGDFIVPAVYQGMFSEIYWLRQGRKLLDKEQYLNVVSLRGEGRNLIVTDNFLVAGMFNPDRQAALLRQIDCTSPLSSTGPVILDIDLDYWSCDTLAGETWEIETTQEEYRRFVEERYHRVRLKFGGKLRAERRDGKYYLVYKLGSVPASASTDRDKTLEGIDQFARWLEANEIRPVMIDICRSRFTGYTPTADWQWIEERLLERLSNVFPLTIKHLDELVTPGPLPA